jgi:hypothetical protein
MTKRNKKMLGLKKMEHVNTYVHRKLRELCPDVLNTTYQDMGDEKEVVKVTFKNDEPLFFDVSGCTLAQIENEVINALTERRIRSAK